MKALSAALRNPVATAFAGFVILSGGAQAQVQVLGPQSPPAQAASEAEPAAGPASACASDAFTIAQMNWPSAAILAHIHANILTEEFGCTVRLVPGDPESTLSSMSTTRQPAAAPEIWASRYPEIWNGALRAQSLRAAGDTYSGGPLEAWFVPGYVKANNPALQNAGDLIDHWRVFAQEGAQTARFISCPSDWACALITEKMLGAFGLDDRFEIVTPEDRLALDRLLTDAVTQGEPVVSYYWQPNGLIDRLELEPLGMGGLDSAAAQCMALAGCVPFGPSSYAPDTVVIALAEWVFTDANEIAAYFGRAVMPVTEMNALLAWQAENEAGIEETAAHFIETRQDLWQQWVDADR
ncbi:glycine betaine ABC transporter substrate-binding protein [Pelagibacterium halotolerans]|uniref:glycine betaine ABC transporter substrate-binding protein n=1 Tax=Pelagibacterium halotolerans TaxID=531813 RepID=UPI00384E9A45